MLNGQITERKTIWWGERKIPLQRRTGRKKLQRVHIVYPAKGVYWGGKRIEGKNLGQMDHDQKIV